MSNYLYLNRQHLILKTVWQTYPPLEGDDIIIIYFTINVWEFPIGGREEFNIKVPIDNGFKDQWVFKFCVHMVIWIVYKYVKFKNSSVNCE